MTVDLGQSSAGRSAVRVQVSRRVGGGGRQGGPRNYLRGPPGVLRLSPWWFGFDAPANMGIVARGKGRQSGSRALAWASGRPRRKDKEGRIQKLGPPPVRCGAPEMNKPIRNRAARRLPDRPGRQCYNDDEAPRRPLSRRTLDSGRRARPLGNMASMASMAGSSMAAWPRSLTTKTMARHAGSLRSAVYPKSTTFRLAYVVRVAHGLC